MFDKKLYNYIEKELVNYDSINIRKSLLIQNEVITIYNDTDPNSNNPHLTMSSKEFNYKTLKHKLLDVKNNTTINELKEQLKAGYLEKGTDIFVLHKEYNEIFEVLYPMVNRKDRLKKLLEEI